MKDANTMGELEESLKRNIVPLDSQTSPHGEPESPGVVRVLEIIGKRLGGISEDKDTPK